MSSLVLELQQEALNPSIDTTDLLRKALLVARKLTIKDFQTWTENELNGYPDNTTLPDYRMISGTPQALNPVHGWQPIMFSSTESEKYWSIYMYGEPISQITSLVNSTNDFLSVSYSAEGAKALSDSISRPTQVRLFFGKAAFASILDIVRTITLKWAIKLEEDNILGEGITFTAHEKEIARSATYNINNFFGTVSSSQIQQHTSDATQFLTMEKADIDLILKFVAEMRAKLSELKLTSERNDELNAELNTIDAQVNSPKPKSSILVDSLLSVRRILEGASGALAAELLISLNSIPAM